MSLLTTFRKFGKKDDGSTAIEFALLAVPFMVTAVGLIELSVYFISASLMEWAVQDAGRLIRTGQLQQTDGDPLEEFLDAVCDRAGYTMDCNNFQYQVRKMDEFADSDPALDEDGNMVPPTQFGVDDITAGCIGLVRVSYPFEFMTPVFGEAWGDYGNSRLIMSTIVFRTEPYQLGTPGANCKVAD